MFSKSRHWEGNSIGRKGSGLSLQYLATLSLIFVTGSRVLEPLGLHVFTNTKYSVSTLYFTMGIYGKSQVGLLEKGIAFPFHNYLLICFLPCIKKGATRTCRNRDNSLTHQWYWVHAMNYLEKVIL